MQAKTTCSIPECDRPATRRGWCEMHYRRWQRTGSPEGMNYASVCMAHGCTSRPLARDLCRKHYYRWKRTGSFEDPRPSHRFNSRLVGFSHLPGLASYSSIHKWLMLHYPHTGRCEWCGRTDRKTDYASVGHRYTLNRADWLELCRRCHKAFDRAF